LPERHGVLLLICLEYHDYGSPKARQMSHQLNYLLNYFLFSILNKI